MRCDVNISLRPHGQQELGAKVELKNLNSTSSVRRAIHHEIERQSSELDQGIAQQQSTRRWDDDLGESQLLRGKEDAHDYRYFPCPDLLPIATAELLARVEQNLPELPDAKRARFVTEFQVSEYDAAVLTSERVLANWFEEACKGAKSSKRVANWIINELLGALNAEGLQIKDSPISPSSLREVADFVEQGSISNTQAKEVFQALMSGNNNPQAIIKERGFEQVSDQGALEAMIDEVLTANPAKKAEFQAGNDKILNWLTGQVMKQSKGKANPAKVAQLLHQKLQ